MIGPSAAIALEDLHPDARGILSGIFEGGTSLGNLLASSMYRALVPTTSYGWRSLFWFGAGPPVLIIIFRWWLPETEHFKRVIAERKAKMEAIEELQQKGTQGGRGRGGRIGEFKAFMHESGKSIKEDWPLLVYMFLLMAGFNACSHGAIDLYPTFLKNQVQMSPARTSMISSIGNVGAFFGGILMGYISGFSGRRLTMMCTCILGASLLPAFLLPRGNVLAACAFFQHFANVGAWGPIPIYLVELAPDTIRTLMVGFTYQLGNLASSPITTIETYYGEKYPLPPAKDGTKRFDYGRAIWIFTGAAWAYTFVCLLLGPEKNRDDEAVIEGAAVVSSSYGNDMDSEPPSPLDSIEKGPVACEVEASRFKV